ncbi:MAG TPA: excalibur calcium-binding domain-containing protein [Euzebyales bacterium]|nr:excalibur calcium-binding domain-containing protein [Euzebyales bacterium]
MSWFHNLNRKQLAGGGGVLAAAAALGLLASGGGATAEPAPAEVVVTETVTETVTEVVTEDSMAAAEVMSERARLNRVKSKLNDRKDELAALTRSLDRRQQELDDQEVAVADVPEASAPEPAAVVDLPADDPEPVVQYFDNCDAARAAGAAPVRRGDPGYGGHLDRDGDGVGCE